MTGTTVLVLLLGLAGIILITFLYLKVEPDVPGRFALLAIRAMLIGIVAALLLGVEMPGDDPTRPVPNGGKWILVDPDLSMTLPAGDSVTLWTEVVERALVEATRGARLALARPGEAGPEGIDPVDLPTRRPGGPPTNLRASVARLGEAGADSILILSTLRRPMADLEALAAEAAVPVRFERIGGVVKNAGVAELALMPERGEDGRLEGEVVVFGEGGEPGDSVRIEVRADGDSLTTVYESMPLAGQEISVPISLPAPTGPGLQRYTARAFVDGDVFAPDDLRSRWLQGGSEPGVLLVSLRPDWEPRILLPVLEAVTGLRGEGYLLIEDGRFLPLAAEAEASRPVDAEQFRDRLNRAELLVVQAAGEETPEWLAAATQAHPRVLLLTGSGTGTGLAGVRAAPVLAGEWAPAPELPASPLSSFLAGISLGGLPPLSSLIPLAGSVSGTPGLWAQGPRGGDPLPALILLEGSEGRRVLALAEGFWRWGVRDGEARGAYRALWGGVANWLLAQPDLLAGNAIRPEQVRQSRDVPLRWETSPGATDLELTLTRVQDGGDGDWELSREGAPRFSGSILSSDDLLATTPAVEPGIYRFEARARPEASAEVARTSGVVEVEAWAPSLRLPPGDQDSLAVAASLAIGLEAEEATRLLRTHPLPYVILLILLGAEWLGRRRVGLR